MENTEEYKGYLRERGRARLRVKSGSWRALRGLIKFKKPSASPGERDGRQLAKRRKGSHRSGSEAKDQPACGPRARNS